MRKIIFVWCLILTLIISGCGIAPPDTEGVSSTNSISVTAGETETEEPGTSTTSAETDDTSAATDIPEVTEGTSATGTSTESETQKEITTDTPETSEKKPDTTTSETTNPEETTNRAEDGTTQPTETETEETKPQDTTSQTEWTPTVYANGSNCNEISALIVQYINEYRSSEGTVDAAYLPGLSEYARYRSTQLVSNFAHDTADERAAATALKYGEYVDPSVYGLSGEPYYTACAGEAIAFTGKVGTVDEVAKHIATMMLNSSEHWVYVGSEDYVYVGVGLTYKSGYWYCDIAMSKVNHG